MFYAKILIVLAVTLCGSAAIIGKEVDLRSDHICALVPEGSLILEAKTCNKWKRCPSAANAEGEEGSCVIGMYFDKEDRRCKNKDSVVCPFEEADKSVSRCNGQKDGVFLQDPETCTGYIFCDSGREIHSTCPGGLVFDPKTAACAYKDKYNCTITEKKATNPICAVLPNNFMFADETDCSKFNICVDGAKKSVECSKDMAYDHKLGKCVAQDAVVCYPGAKEPEPENNICGTKEEPYVGIRSDENSCSHYYVCAKKLSGQDRQPQHVKCEGGKFFDIDNMSCRDRLNVKCTLDRCEDMGNKYVNIAGDCTAYARCHNGVSVDKGKCPSQYFFDERSQGCTPHIVSYAACQAEPKKNVPEKSQPRP